MNTIYNLLDVAMFPLKMLFKDCAAFSQNQLRFI